MNLDPTAIDETSTPADVLAAFLPIVDGAWKELWGVEAWPRYRTPFEDSEDVYALSLAGPSRDEEGGFERADQVWACVAASYLMGPLMEFFAAETAYLRVSRDDRDDLSNDYVERLAAAASRAIRAREAIDAAALRLRDYWCEKRQETDR